MPFACVKVCNKRELRLIQNQRHIVQPEVTLKCVPWQTQPSS